MNTKSISILSLMLCFGIMGAGTAIGQDDVRSRSITPDDYSRKRPASPKKARKKRLPSYAFVRAEKNVARERNRSPAPHKPEAAFPPGTFTEVGVTVWRLRPPRSNENGYLFEVLLDDKQTRQMWIAERVGVDTQFDRGDKVRIGIESSAVGYLYVFDRETYSDGSLGVPSLIFPESVRDDNSVGPGLLVDIPDQRDDLAYFKMIPQQANHTGELLTVVISPTPLADMEVDAAGQLLNAKVLADMEFGSESELFNRKDMEDWIYSKTEADSACGAKSRQLVRETSAGKPCGIKSRKLTREESLPQSIYRVKSRPGKPAVVFVKLAVR